MYTKTNTNKIHEKQGVKFLQNKRCSVYESEEFIYVIKFPIQEHIFSDVKFVKMNENTLFEDCVSCITHLKQ